MLRVCALILLVGSLTFWVPGVVQVNAQSARSSAHVYFLTGLFGVGSALDGVATKVKNRGVPITMSSPNGWQALGQSAIKGYRSDGLRSIVIVGYSAGGGAALDMATHLNAANVPTQLVVIVDGLSGPPVPPNVRKLVNYYVAGGIGTPIARPLNFRGVLQNIPVKDARIGHFSIIGAHEGQLLAQLLSAAGGGGPSRSSSSTP